MLQEHQGGKERICPKHTGKSRNIFTSDMGLRGWTGLAWTRKDRKKDKVEPAAGGREKGCVIFHVCSMEPITGYLGVLNTVSTPEAGV